jgi:vitamin B12/bleomycin/antimicrobial peptide transport system ATP-binding/permease protein
MSEAVTARSETVTTRIAAARGFLAKLWKLASPYWWAEDVAELNVLGFRFRLREKWVARGLLATIIAMAVMIVYAAKLLNEWNARFFNALQEKDQAAFLAELRYWVIVVFIYIVIAVYRVWLRQMLSIRWRRWLTGTYYAAWLRDRTYYRMELQGQGTDNPEQRIEYDIAFFTTQTLTIGLGLISEVLTLVTFTVVLWNLSGSITVMGVTVPGYMMWVAVIYAAVGSTLTYLIGRHLVRVNFDLERYNADFRYRMMRVRENAESIALYGGEPDEGRRLGGAFARIFDTYWRYMVLNKRLQWLTFFYYQAASIFPLIVASPRYFTGEIPLGVLTQTAGAFGQVQGSLSWFVDTFSILADWKANVDRLTGFSEAMERAKREAAQGARELAVEPAPAAGALALDDVQVLLPNGRVLLEDVDVEIRDGERVVLQGPSGSGKTTLFRVLAGLWPFGKGRVRVPSGAKVLFLPQRPYIPIGSLREALCYPDRPEAHADPEIVKALQACQLGHLADRLDEAGNWSLTLSGGEQQRLAFARAVLVKPDWLFLDEATSALDEANETALYELIRDRLPDATVISIAHKPSVAAYHDRRLRIDPARKKVVSEPVGAAA